MWLINVDTLELEDFLNENRPSYAILSHTWGAQEATFTRFVDSPDTAQNDPKISNTCRVAKQYGFKYVWIDTCCIDKRSSAELSEAINSMYRWYQEADICFVYLEDLPHTMSIADGLHDCRWRTRGWTLQELIAPKDIQFFDADWQLRGSKKELLHDLAQSTRIPMALLDGTHPLEYYEAASKMAWASDRQTSRTEDRAYCLMGIFDINMPLLYGEGQRAFQRLQEEIFKKMPDLSLLLWQGWNDDRLYLSRVAQFTRRKGSEQATTESLQAVPLTKRQRAFLPVLARSPKDFSAADPNLAIVVDEAIEFSMNQLAIVIHNDGAKLKIMEHGYATTDHPMQYWFDVRALMGGQLTKKWLPLRKIAPATYAIESREDSIPESGGLISASVIPKMSLVLRPGVHTISRAIEARRNGIRVPLILLQGYYISAVRPKSHWDPTDQIFFRDALGSGTQAVFAIELRARDRHDKQVFMILFEPTWTESTRCKVARISNETTPKSNHDRDVVALNQQIFGPYSDTGYAWNVLTARWPDVSRWNVGTFVQTGKKSPEQNFVVKLQSSVMVSFGQQIPVFDLGIHMRPARCG